MKDFLELMEEGDRLETSLSSVTHSITNFEEKLVRFIELVANKPQYPSWKRAILLKEAESTSDFPYLFGTVLDRQLYAKYMAATPDWKSYIKTGTQRDFRPQALIGVFGNRGAFPPVASPSGEYVQDANYSDGQVLITLNKYGRRIGLKWELLINDDLGAFADIAGDLALGALRREYRVATSLFCTATGPNPALFGAPIQHPIEKRNIINLFSSANKLSVVGTDGSISSVTPFFNADNLAAAASVMRRFVDADGEPVIFDGFELVVPPRLEVRMLQALNPANVIQSGGDATAGAKPVIRSSSNTAAQLNITGHVNPYMPIIYLSGNADNTWYLFGRLAGNGGYAARINYLAGHEAPEIAMKNPNKVSLSGANFSPLEGDFEADQVEWRGRHILGGKPCDPVYAAAFVGA